jgi:acyl-CoA reductase-like NAD-dependent aldehyde dehydrogenase
MAEIHTILVRNPRTGELDYEITSTTPDQIAAYADAAIMALGTWQVNGLEKRCKAILGLAEAFESNATEIAKALEIDTGRRRMANMEVHGVIGSMRGWAAQAPMLMPKAGWQQGRMKPEFKHTNQFVPYDLVGVISPWNFPMTLSFIDAIPALLAGCAVLIKPSEVTPRFADVLKPIIENSELAEVLDFVQGDGRTGAALIDHVDCVCFTGSVATGKKVAVKAAENLIPANLELGGKDPLIITENADMDAATTLALRSSVLATGQACQSIERVYVPAPMYGEFTNQLAEKAKASTLNWPDIDKGQIGPFIFERQADIVKAQIDDAVAKGAKVLSGGEILTHGGGRWLEPTVIANVDHSMDIMREETFGPVIPVMPYIHVDHAIELANDTEFGLSAGVFADTLENARKIGEGIDAGAISLMDAALTGQYFEAGKQAFKNSGMGPSRMGEDGFLRFFRKKALIANTVAPLALDDFAEDT